MTLLFYPRGGSSQVVRYLVPALEAVGWPVSLVAGSVGEPGDRTHAESFFKHHRLTVVDYDPALAAHRAGRDPLAEPVPMHPSFEDRPGAPDPVIAAIPPQAGDHVAAAWDHVLERGWEQPPAVAHLHHLTPVHEAVARRYPGMPIITHLHGTEIQLLDHIDRLRGLAGILGMDLAAMAESGGQGARSADLDPEERRLLRETRWEQWRYGDHWARRLRHAARMSDRIVAISPHLRDEARALLDVPPELVESIPNGVDIERFDRQVLDRTERLGRWRRWLVEEPLGADESGEPGTIRYREEDLRWFEASAQGDHAPVLMFVGRFTEVKRVPLLVRAYARARDRFATPAPLVLWGGFPGEWEGEHPFAVAREVGEAGIFFVGWRGHTELPEGLTCADVMVAPSAREGFGQMLIEAMSCGVPVIATRSGGPVSFVNTDSARPNGWLIPPDDIDALADALVAAVNEEQTRAVRGANGYRQIRASHSWDATARAFTALYEEVLARPAPQRAQPH
jgi:glycosyltransferase involved in cell wall biosynthesis